MCVCNCVYERACPRARAGGCERGWVRAWVDGWVRAWVRASARARTCVCVCDVETSELKNLRMVSCLSYISA